MAPSVLLLLLQHSAAFHLLQHRTNAPLQQRTNAATAMRASDDALDASSPDAFLAGLMNRVDELKARQLELPIVVLDATLPNQRLAISTSDQAFREMVEFCGVKAVEEAGDEQFDDTRHGRFGIVGVDRQTGNAFPFNAGYQRPCFHHTATDAIKRLRNDVCEKHDSAWKGGFYRTNELNIIRGFNPR